MKYFMRIWLSLFVIFVILLEFNPLGLGQIVIWQFRPPYHWVNGTAVIQESLLVDRDGSTCADMYFNLEKEWHVYGYGFSRSYRNRDSAVERANSECR